MLRIATAQFYQQGAKAMNGGQMALAKVQQQMATGQRILANADDPVGSARLLSLKDELGRYDQYQRNIDVASGRMSLEESTLGDAGELLQRTRELTIQANNAPLNDNDRRDIAKEIRQIHSQMFSLANTKDGDGEYLFSGFQSRSQPFVLDANNQAIYQGDQGQRLVKAGPTLDVPVSDSGDEVFRGALNGNGSFRVTATATNTGNGSIAVGSVTDPTAFAGHSYSIAFTSATTFDVTDTTTGTAVLSNQSYKDEGSIQFAGLQTAVSGSPAAGDTFTIQPATRQDFFKTLDDLATALETSGGTPAKGAQLNQALANGLAALDQGLEHLTGVRAKAGSRLKALEEQTTVNGDFATHLQQTINDVGGLDYAEAATRLSQETFTLQVAQQSFVRIQSLSLFNYMR
ncbi:MAG: flagellar hook-associated protein FlgL [Candidatus Competibacteraceae bacterium]|nr:flagellar hook-associated protein FlgL [Candidatus Competibacteraceae bacterium]MBK8895761.1 flagellar hook-associated protein FlgL [Candidatus Competibacteraceae bacterium]MBK8962854.1 flagellar hook-associated protein FlgL [Candidatus Competibacteraceae bacterium]